MYQVVVGRCSEIGKVQRQRFKAMVVRQVKLNLVIAQATECKRCESKIQYAVGLHNKDKEEEEEIKGIGHWGEDEGARWYLKSEAEGQYELIYGAFRTARGGGLALRPVAEAEQDRAFRVQKSDYCIQRPGLGPRLKL